MKLNLTDLLRGRKREITFSESITVDQSQVIKSHTIDSVDPIAVEGRVYYLRDELWIQLSYKGMVHFICDRCLQPFNQPLDGQIKTTLSTRDEFDVEWLIIRDEHIDITEAIVDDIAMQLPIQVVCSEGCKGLCSTCGVDLNHSHCQCLEEKIDPRFAVLKDLFN